MEHDPATGLGAKRAFSARGEALVGDGKPFVLALANVDHFKRFNMHNGHRAGDAVLVALADQLRGLDAYRIGGDGFAVFLADEAEAEALRATVAANVNPAQPADCGDARCMGLAPPPRLSFGVSRWTGGTFAELVTRADEAMIRAKRNGRDRVERG